MILRGSKSHAYGTAALLSPYPELARLLPIRWIREVDVVIFGSSLEKYTFVQSLDSCNF